MQVYSLINSDLTFHPKVKRTMCSIYGECIVIELTFGEIVEAAENEAHPLRAYVSESVLRLYKKFFNAVKAITPDHVVPEDKVFIVYDDIEDWRGETSVYILFKHFEHCSSNELLRILIELNSLCEATDCTYAGLEEFSCADEYILLELRYPSLDRYVNNAIYRKTNPWRRLIVAYLQDHVLETAAAFVWDIASRPADTEKMDSEELYREILKCMKAEGGKVGNDLAEAPLTYILSIARSCLEKLGGRTSRR